MKKRFILSYIMISLVSVFFTSCDDRLIEEPASSIAPDQFFQNEAQCTQAVNGVYSYLNDLFGHEDLWRGIEHGTDLMLYFPTNDFTQEYTITAAAPGNIGAVYSKCYKAIGSANLVINRIGKANIPEAIKARLIAEAKYLRALHYYVLSNTFGAVPMWTDELDVDVVSKLARTPVAAVRAQIKADLLEASASLPPSYAAADVGRVTKGAAYGLLAKVYLFEKDWANAEKYAQMVVGLNQYQLVNYADLFDISNRFPNNKESVFEIQFKRDAATNTNVKVHYYYTWFFPLKDANGKTHAGIDFGTTVLRGYENYYPSTVLVNLFDNADKRKAVTLATGYGTQNFNRFLKPGRPWFGGKFWDITANDRNSAKSIYFMRYSEILLILAEALNEQNKPGDALTWINKVRLDHGGLTTPLAGDQTAVRTIIMNERAIEFVGEFQRRWDLVRWGKLVDAVKSVANDNPKGAANVKAEYGLSPIPEGEYIKNPNLLPQNPGYN